MSDDKFTRYSLRLDNDTFEQIQGIAEKDGQSMLTVIRRFIKIGLVVWKDDNYCVAYENSVNGKLEKVIIL